MVFGGSQKVYLGVESLLLRQFFFYLCGSQVLGSAINNVHEDCPDEQLIIGTKCADFAERMAEAIAGRVEQLVRMLCNKVKRDFCDS